MAQREVREALVKATFAALRPLVRRLLASGVTFRQLEMRLQELCVEIAEHALDEPDTVPTDSRVAIFTGINRKAVHRIRSRARDVARPVSGPSVVTSLVSRWTNGARTTDARGRPIPLPYDAPRGPSFVALARATTADLHPRALLDTLISAGAAELRDRDMVVLRRAAYVAQRGRPEALAMLADDPPELLETMLHNVLDPGEQLLQQKLSYDNIGRDGIARLRAALRREAERFLRAAEHQLIRHDRDRNPRAPGGERTSAGVGIYYFERPRERSAEPSAAKIVGRKRIKRRRTPS